MSREASWTQRAKIWQGLENFRQVILDLFTNDTSKMIQASIDKLFAGYDFQLQESRKQELLDELTEQIEKLDEDTELAEQMKAQKEQLEMMVEDLILRRSTESFDYEYVLKSGVSNVNLVGFVKITKRDNPEHKALLSWQHDSREPILFLAELEGEKIYFHINISKEDGLAVLEEAEGGYRWTHCLACDYPELMDAEFGSVFMEKDSKEIKLEDGNIAAATALSKAQTKNDQGLTLMENNVALMHTYKKDLESLDFNY